MQLYRVMAVGISVLQLVHSKEIVATAEWQFLSDNDTILSTGEKWVKIPTDDSRDDSIKAAIYGDKVEKVEVGGDGELNIEYEPYDDEE